MKKLLLQRRACTQAVFMGLILCTGFIQCKPAKPEKAERSEKGEKKEKTEVKFVFAEKDFDAAAKALKLKNLPDGEGSICFFETKGRDLDKQMLILRARYLDKEDGLAADPANDKNGTTVKLRTKGTVDRDKEKNWVKAIKEDKGLGKIEKDQVVGKSAVESLSLNSARERAAIEAADKPGGEKASIFSDKQQAFVADHLALKWERLLNVGPIVSRTWKKIKVEGLEEPLLGAEEWVLSKPGQDSKRLLEVSAKVETDKADEFAKNLKAAMKKLGFEQDPDAETKTRTLFLYFLGKE